LWLYGELPEYLAERKKLFKEPTQFVTLLQSFGQWQVLHRRSLRPLEGPIPRLEPWETLRRESTLQRAAIYDYLGVSRLAGLYSHSFIAIAVVRQA